MQHSGGETQRWLDGCWHSPEPAGTHSTSCNIGKFQNKISCTKSQGCDSAETWLYNWICQKPVTLNVQLPTRRAAPRHAPWPVLALPLSLPLGRQPGIPCPDVPIVPTHCRNIPNRCCPARCWEWLRQERCSSHPFQTPTPRHSTWQELFPPIWSSGLGTPGLLSHRGAAGCSCGFLYEEAGVFAPKGCGPRCHHRPGWCSGSITPPCLTHCPDASPAAMVTLMDGFLFGNLFPSHSFSATT